MARIILPIALDPGDLAWRSWYMSYDPSAKTLTTYIDGEFDSRVDTSESEDGKGSNGNGDSPDGETAG